MPALLALRKQESAAVVRKRAFACPIGRGGAEDPHELCRQDHTIRNPVGDVAVGGSCKVEHFKDLGNKQKTKLLYSID